MAIKGIIDTLDGLDDALKGLYVADGEKYRLDVEGGFKTAAEVEGLTTALGKEREANKANGKIIKAFEGIDPAAARDALAKVKTWSDDEAKRAEKAEQELQARLAPLTAERDKLKADNEKFRAELDSFKVDSALSSAKVFEKVADPIYREHLQSIVRKNLKVEDGVLVGYKADGQQVFDTNGNPAQGEDLIRGIVDSIPNVANYYSGSHTSGSGASPNGSNGGTRGKNPWAKDSWNVTEQAQMYIQDKQTAIMLAKAAGYEIS